MQKNTRIFLLALTALVILVCFYCLSFTFKVNSIEKKATEMAAAKVKMGDVNQLFPGNKLMQFVYEDSIRQARINVKNRYLDSISGEKVYLGNTYNDCKKQQLSLGLDLQGGMSVVLQVSLKELLVSIADDNKEVSFRTALENADKQLATNNSDFITLFLAEFKKLNPTGKLGPVFSNRQNSDEIKMNSSDAEVEKYLRKEAGSAINRTYSIINSRINQFGTKEPIVTLDPKKGRITVEIAGVDNPSRVRKLLQATAQLEFWETYKATQLGQSINNANTALKNYLDNQKDLGKDTTKKATNALDNIFSDNTTDTAAKNDLLNGKKDTSKAKKFEEFKNENPLFSVLQPVVNQQNQFMETPMFGYVKAVDTAILNSYLNNPDVRAVFPPDFEFMYSAKPLSDEGKVKVFGVYAIKKTSNDEDAKAPLDGSSVIQARGDVGQDGGVVVDMAMNSEGTRAWKLLTGKNIGNHIAIVVDKQVYSAPVVNGEIDGGRSQISGGFTQQEADDLSNILKIGKLPASARIVEEEIIGPSLGQKSIRDSLVSLLASFILIMAFMVMFYSTGGVVAIIVMILNLFLIIGCLAAGNGTLTLPGMAGIVLTLGMAVDANVIIYERIKEELRDGKTHLTAIAEGFKHSYAAILDGNITTFITALILFIFGLGPIKGFALTLMIGIVTTLFTAVLLSKIIVDWRSEKGHALQFYTNATKNFLQGKNFDFIGRRKITYLISSIVIIAGIISMFTKGFELGVDFKGGREYKIRFEEAVNTSEIRDELSKTLGNSTIVKQFGSPNQIKVTTSYKINERTKEADVAVEQAVYKGLSKHLKGTSFTTFNDVNVMSSTKIDPTVSVDIKKSSFWAALISLVAIFLYILIRFRRYGYSVGAIAATAHDAFIVIALFSILHGILPFAMEIDQAFIAAILTVIGYSINDTVIIFDRLREYIKLYPNKSRKETMNDAINSTLSRTFNTAFTVFITVLILFLFGGSVLKSFSFAMLIGVVVGCYSSVFIASPIMYDLDGGENVVQPTNTTTPANPKKGK